FISASHLADLIYGKEQEIRILDIQGEEAFQKYHIPSSLRYNGEDPLPGNETSGMIILCGRAEDPEVYQIAGQFDGKVFVVKGGIEQWYDLVLFPDFLKMQVRNSERLREMHYRSYYFGGTPRNNQLLNISVRENRFREGC
ncbi:MAG: hypothetical protein KAT15_28335, partial [Bacteroidales bacterium]|nr:hypothetical protein [Bacteroidales bacterium]